MQLKLVNNLSKVEYELSGITDNSNSSIYYNFTVSLPSGITDGEYSYSLINNNAVVAEGLCQVGDYVAEHTTYTAATKTYKVYGE